jgi:uncharacterized protein DUF481
MIHGGAHGLCATALAALAVLLGSATLVAQGRTDVVSLANGDRITGEIVRLERGRLEYETDDAGTLYLEWDNLASLITTRLMEVTTSDGRVFLGTLGPSPVRSMNVVATDGTNFFLQMEEVTFMTPIGATFWRRLDGSIDVGFSYTRSSGVAQLNMNSDTVFRRPQFESRLTASLTQTQTEDEEGRDDRAQIELSYLRYRWQNWFVSGIGRFETNESLGLELRSQVGLMTGPRLVNSNRAQVLAGAGVAFNDERGVDVEPTQNVEGLFSLLMSYFTYDRPKTNLDLNFQYYPSFSNWGRQRLQLDTSARRELLKDFFVAVNVFDTFDSEPPNPDADTNDVGVVVSVGWSY